MKSIGAFLGLFLAVSGCAAPSLEGVAQGQGSSIFSETCMPALRQAQSAEMPELAQFIEDSTRELFSCEYFIGKPLRYFGLGGPKLKVKGRSLHAGAGYAIVETKAGGTSHNLDHTLGLERVGKYYVLPKGFSLRAEMTVVAVRGQSLPAYFLYATAPYVPERMIAALAFSDFAWRGRTYRTYLWAQDFPLTKQEVVSRFGYMKSFIIEAPSGMVVSR